MTATDPVRSTRAALDDARSIVYRYMSPTLQYAWPALSGRGRPAGLLSGANVDHEIFAQVLLSGKAPQIPT